MALQLLGCGTEYHDFPDASGGDFVMAPFKGAQLYVAKGTAREPEELEMDESLGIGNLDLLGRSGYERAFVDYLSWIDLGH
jgi:hypothetical protein